MRDGGVCVKKTALGDAIQPEITAQGATLPVSHQRILLFRIVATVERQR